MKKKIVKHFIIIGSLILAFLIVSLFKINSTLADFFSTHISNFFITIIGTITSLLPFAIFEFFLLSMVGFGLFIIIITIKSFVKKNKEKGIDNLFGFFKYILSILLIYTITTGVAYYRSPINLPMYEGDIPITLVDEAISYYLKDYNELADSFSRDKNDVSVCPYSFKELSKMMREEVKRLDENPYFYKFNARAKPTLFSPILSELHITGVDFPFTAEANVNFVMPSIDIPFTMAHEIAHLKGVMREDDANTVALYICITSSDPYIRYSGYFRGFFRLLEIKQYTNYQEYVSILNSVSNNVYKDNAHYNKYFQEHDFLEKLSTLINDIYLMLNGQEEGTGSYEDTSDTIVSGKDEYGNEIREYTSYSNYQKLLIQNYLLNKNK